MCAFAQGQQVEVFSKSQGQWLPAVIEKVYEQQTVENGRAVPAGCLLVSSAAGKKYILADQVSATVRLSSFAVKEKAFSAHSLTAASLKPGDTVEVFSESQGRWLHAIVEAVFTEAAIEQGRSVPAGCVRVKSASGSKYVPAEHMNTTVRAIKNCSKDIAEIERQSSGISRRTSGSSILSLASVKSGDKVQVFSNSHRTWLPAEVEEKYEKDTIEKGRTIPAGCLRVKSSAGSKYVPAEMIESVLRSLPMQDLLRPPPPPGTVISPASSPGAGLPSRYETLRPGDEVEVYSNSQGQWLPGVVEEVYQRDTLQGVQKIPAGCIRIKSSAGIKYIPADKRAEMLRPGKASALATEAGLSATPRPCPDHTIFGVGGA